MSSKIDPQDSGPLSLYGKRASPEDVVAVLWQGVTVVFPVGGDLDGGDPDGIITQEVEVLDKHAEVFGMTQFLRLIGDGCDDWLQVQWCWETVGDATCASPYVPDGMKVLTGTPGAWPTPFLAK